MSLQLTSRTTSGERLVALAETLASEIARDAGIHDREGSFPFESFVAVKASGYFTAPIPEQFGGLGVTSGIAESAHALAVRRLAERGTNGDGRDGVLVAESTIELAACRAVFARAASLIDEHHEDNPTSPGTDEELTALFSESQA